MTKSELIQRFAKHCPQGVRDGKIVVQTILDEIAERLTHGHRIEIRGFGSFSLTYRPSWTGRNPKSGKEVQVPAKYAPHFKGGKELRNRVKNNKLLSHTGVS